MVTATRYMYVYHVYSKQKSVSIIDKIHEMKMIEKQKQKKSVKITLQWKNEFKKRLFWFILSSKSNTQSSFFLYI